MRFEYRLINDLRMNSVDCKRVYDYKNSIYVECENEILCFKWEELGYFRIYD